MHVTVLLAGLLAVAGGVVAVPATPGLLPGILLHGTVGPVPSKACVVLHALSLDGNEVNLERLREALGGGQWLRPRDPPTHATSPCSTPHETTTTVCPNATVTDFALHIDAQPAAGHPTPLVVTAAVRGRAGPAVTRLVAVHGHVGHVQLDLNVPVAASEARKKGFSPTTAFASHPELPATLGHLGIAAFVGGLTLGFFLSFGRNLMASGRRRRAVGRTDSSRADGEAAAHVWEREGARLVKRAADGDGDRGPDWERVPAVEGGG